jgi:hypothetical protein
MSVDVDSWSSLLRFYSIDHDPDEASRQVRDEAGVRKLLNLFEEHRIESTFFVPGEMAQSHPETIRTITDRGHEVACHGLYHGRNECLLAKRVQQDQIERAAKVIKSVTGKQPAGFRAPCLRANRATLEILNKMGFLYDSSFLPMFIPGYYGSLSLRSKPYYPFSKGCDGLLEIPISTNPIIPIPLSASWMRNMGLRWVKFGIRMLFDMKSSVMLYVHPRDVLNLPSIPGIPWHLYRNTGNECLNMLDELLRFVKSSGGRITRAMDLALMARRHCC